MYLKISFRTEHCFGCRSSGCLFMRSSPLMPSWEAAVWWTWTLSVKDVPKEPANKTSSFVNTEWTKPRTSSIRYQSSRKSLKIAQHFDLSSILLRTTTWSGFALATPLSQSDFVAYIDFCIEWVFFILQICHQHKVILFWQIREEAESKEDLLGKCQPTEMIKRKIEY